MKNGVPWELAFGRGLDRTERDALTILFQEFDGAKFNWRSMEFERSD